MDQRCCDQCKKFFDVEEGGSDLICPECIKKLHGGRFGYRQMKSGPFEGKWPVFDHQVGRVLAYAKDEEMALGSVLVLDILESLNLVDAEL